MLIDKGLIAAYIMRLIKNEKKITEQNVISSLFTKQITDYTPIAPFEVDNEGNLSSQLVDNVISDLVTNNFLKNREGIFSSSGLANPYESIIDSLTISPAGPISFGELKTREVLKLGEESFRIKYTASTKTRQFARLLPVAPDIGPFFLLPPHNPTFVYGIPVETDDPRRCCVITADEALPQHFARCNKNLNKIKSHAYWLLGISYSKDLMARMGSIIFLNLIPLSAIEAQHFCKKGHLVASQNAEQYQMLLDDAPTGRCNQCYGKITYSFYICKNEKIVTDWKNGALSEWLASSAFTKVGIPKVFWNIEVEDEQCDVLAFDGKRIFVVECKRCTTKDSQFRAGVEKLQALDNLLSKSDFEVVKILFTCLEDKVEKPTNVNVLIDQTTYLDFLNNLLSFL